MTRSLKTIFCCGAWFISLITFSQNNKDFSIFEDLVETVTHNDTVPPAVPLELEDIVSNYYAETIVPESEAYSVLSYLTDAYSEHGYHDTGNWAPQKRTYRYVPYKGELPDYDIKEFCLPAKGRLTSPYGYRRKFHRVHRGIDISLNIGDTVKCVLPGVVSKTGFERDGYGRYVVVAHAGGLETVYGHLSAGVVTPGMKLNAGDALGLGGNTGNSTGPHLHFETRYLGVAVDPSTWFSLFNNWDFKE